MFKPLHQMHQSGSTSNNDDSGYGPISDDSMMDTSEPLDHFQNQSSRDGGPLSYQQNRPPSTASSNDYSNECKVLGRLH